MNFLANPWAQLALLSLANLFAGSLYSWSIFAPALAERLGAASATDLGWIFGIASAVNPVAMILGGWVNDRFGPRLTLSAGGLMIGAGMAASGAVPSVTALALAYGVLFGFGVGLAYVSTVGTAMRLFPGRRGLAGGIVTMAYGLSSMMIPPVATALLAGAGISFCLLALGVCSGGVILLCGLLSRKPGARDAGGGAVVEAGADTDLDWKGMLLTARFWPMLALFICGSIPAMMIISGAATLARTEGGFSAAAAAGAIALIAVANTCGRFASGIVSDRIGRIPTLAGALFLAIAGLGLLWLGTGSSAVFLVGIALAAWCYGSFVGVYPGFTIENFGVRHASVNYGVMAAGFSSAGVIGPMLLGLGDASSRAPAFAAAAGVSLIGLLFAALCLRLCGRIEPAEKGVPDVRPESVPHHSEKIAL